MKHTISKRNNWHSITDLAHAYAISRKQLDMAIYTHKNVHWHRKEGNRRYVNKNFLDRHMETKQYLANTLPGLIYEAMEQTNLSYTALARELHKLYPYHTVNSYYMFINQEVFAPVECLHSYTCLKINSRAIHTYRGIKAILRRIQHD